MHERSFPARGENKLSRFETSAKSSLAAPRSQGRQHTCKQRTTIGRPRSTSALRLLWHIAKQPPIMTTATMSPSSSPRLPSPPPIAEDQLGPTSPLPRTDEQQKLFSNLDHGAARRIRPGTKAEDMAEGPPLVDLSEVCDRPLPVHLCY